MNQVQDDVRAVLERLAAGGRLTPEMVVEEARTPDSPLHNLFEWDVATAAAAHWIDRAREIIRSVRVTVKTSETVVRAPYYVRDPAAGPGEQGYVSVKTLRTDEDRAREALVEEFKRVAQVLHRARELAVALDLANEVEGLLDNVVRVRRQVEAHQGAPA